MNDSALFNASDEKYAVANAREQVRQNATSIIDSNIENGVVKWLENNYK